MVFETITLALCVAVKDAGRDFTYLIVVVIGLGVTGDNTQLGNHVSIEKAFILAFSYACIECKHVGFFRGTIVCRVPGAVLYQQSQ